MNAFRNEQALQRKIDIDKTTSVLLKLKQSSFMNRLVDPDLSLHLIHTAQYIGPTTTRTVALFVFISGDVCLVLRNESSRFSVHVMDTLQRVVIHLRCHANHAQMRKNRESERKREGDKGRQKPSHDRN